MQGRAAPIPLAAGQYKTKTPMYIEGNETPMHMATRHSKTKNANARNESRRCTQKRATAKPKSNANAHIVKNGNMHIGEITNVHCKLVGKKINKK